MTLNAYDIKAKYKKYYVSWCKNSLSPQYLEQI